MCLKNQQHYLAVKNGNYSFLFLKLCKLISQNKRKDIPYVL